MEKQIVISALAALAQETRLDVFRLLVQAGPEGVSAGTIGSALGLPTATLSFHLKELKSSGLVRCDRQGRSRIYSPNFAVVNELIAFLSENCCRGIDGSEPAGSACSIEDLGSCESSDSSGRAGDTG